MPIEGFGPVLSAPIDLSQVSHSEIEQAADTLIQEGSPFTKDELISQLTYMKDHGITLQQKNIDNVLSGDPILSSPEILTIGLDELNEIVAANPWMEANPFATFVINFLELSALMSKIKLDEALTHIAGSINMIMSMAQDQAELIMDSAEAEAMMHFASAAAAAAGGAFMAASGGIGLAKLKGKNVSQAQITRVQSFNMIVGQAMPQFMTSFEKVVHGVGTLHKGAIDAFKTIIENALKIEERRLNSAIDSYKAADDQIREILQTLGKIIDEAYKAHGFQVH